MNSPELLVSTTAKSRQPKFKLETSTETVKLLGLHE